MSKKNLILGGVLILLLALAFAYKGPFEDWQKKEAKADSFLTNLDVDKIDRIELKKGESAKVFIKDGDKWREEGVKTTLLDNAAVEEVISAVKKAKESDLKLVSEVKDKQTDFETSEDKGTRVVLKKGEDSLREFFIGKNTSDFQGSYISEIGSNRTYSVNANLTSAVNKEDWYDESIFAVDKSALKKIRFQFPSREFTIQKSDAKEGEEYIWEGTLPYKFPVDAKKMEEITRLMSELKAVKIPEQKFAGTGLEKNQMIIEASGDGVNNVLMVGDKNKEGFYFAKRGDSDNLYLISKEDRDKLDMRISDLK